MYFFRALKRLIFFFFFGCAKCCANCPWLCLGRWGRARNLAVVRNMAIFFLSLNETPRKKKQRPYSTSMYSIRRKLGKCSMQKNSRASRFFFSLISVFLATFSRFLLNVCAYIDAYISSGCARAAVYEIRVVGQACRRAPVTIYTSATVSGCLRRFSARGHPIESRILATLRWGRNARKRPSV